MSTCQIIFLFLVLNHHLLLSQCHSYELLDIKRNEVYNTQFYFSDQIKLQKLEKLIFNIQV